MLYIFFHFLKLVYLTGRYRKNTSSAGSFPKCLQWLILKAELNAGVPCEWHEPNYLSHHLCHPLAYFSKKLESEIKFRNSTVGPENPKVSTTVLTTCPLIITFIQVMMAVSFCLTQLVNLYSFLWDVFLIIHGSLWIFPFCYLIATITNYSKNFVT